MAKTAGEAAVLQRRMPLKERISTLPRRLRLALRKYWFIYLLALPGIIFFAAVQLRSHVRHPAGLQGFQNQ